MSTILEALKKSEQERRLNEVPTLSDMTAPQESSKWPVFLLAGLVVLLSIILIVLAIRWWSVVPIGEKSAIEISNETLADQQASQAGTGDKIVVNVVSYSETAEQSFVMINGRLYRENEFVRAGLKVEKIEADRVVLNLRGRRIERKP